MCDVLIRFQSDCTERNVTVQKFAHFWFFKNVTKRPVARNRNVAVKTAVIFKYFNSYLSVISLSGYNYLAVIMSVSTEEDAINAMLLQFGGEDVELVLDELRKCQKSSSREAMHRKNA